MRRWRWRSGRRRRRWRSSTVPPPPAPPVLRPDALPVLLPVLTPPAQPAPRQSKTYFEGSSAPEINTKGISSDDNYGASLDCLMSRLVPMVHPDPQWPSVAATPESLSPLGLLESPTQVFFRRRMALRTTPADPPPLFCMNIFRCFRLREADRVLERILFNSLLFFVIPW